MHQQLCVSQIVLCCVSAALINPTNRQKSVAVSERVPRNAAVLHVQVCAMTCAALHVNSSEIHLRVNPLRAILVQA